MIKIYKDTDIIVNKDDNEIILTRGYWNFNQIRMDLRDIKNKDKVFEIFEKLEEVGYLDIEHLNKELKDSLMQLVKAGLLFESGNKKKEERKILLISDDCEYVSNKLENVSYIDKIDIMDKEEMEKNYFGNNSIFKIKQNPLLETKIKANVENFIKDNRYSAVALFLYKAADDFCQKINNIFGSIEDMEISYCIFDKDFTYLFGTKKLYTGCYSCFSKRMEAKMKTSRLSVQRKGLRTYGEAGYKCYHMDFAYSLFIYNLEEYINTGSLPMLGRLAAIFNSTLEVKYENLLRLSFCPECGYIGRLENKERNIRLANYLKEMNSHDKISD